MCRISGYVSGFLLARMTRTMAELVSRLPVWKPTVTENEPSDAEKKRIEITATNSISELLVEIALIYMRNC